MSDRTNRKPETGAFFPRDRQWHAPALTPGYKTSVLRSPQKALLSLDGTISEITGPVFGHSVIGELDNDLIHNFARAGESAIGERIIVHGRVLDERGRAVPGALLEFWQANAGGRYRHKKESYLAPLDPNFGGCGRTITDDEGRKKLIEEKRSEYEARQKQQDAFANNHYPQGAQLCSKCSTAAVVMMDGCMTCLNCGDSKCG